MHTQSSFKKTETEKKTFFSCFLKKTEVTLKKSVSQNVSYPPQFICTVHVLDNIQNYFIITNQNVCSTEFSLTIARSPMATEHNNRLLKTHFKVAHLATNVLIKTF